MSTQLSKEKLNIIRRTLVQNKFSAKIKEIENALGKMIFEKRMNAIPKHILAAWESTPEKELSIFIQPLQHISVDMHRIC